MKDFCKHIFLGIAIFALKTVSEQPMLFASVYPDYSYSYSHLTEPSLLFQTPDSVVLPFPIPSGDGQGDGEAPSSPLFLQPPQNITTTVVYDPVAKIYTVYYKVGDINIRPPQAMSEDEYRRFQFEQSMREYWQQRQKGETSARGSGILPRLQVGGETFDRVFGSNVIEIIPQGTAELIFGVTHTKTDNPNIAEDLRSNVTFDFKSKIQMNVDGTVGEKLKMSVNYNTEATFDFEQNVKVEYTGFEDEIIQKIEAGNVSLPLPGSLITGSHSLFGLKTQLKFGKLTVTSIFSKQDGQTQVMEVRGGAQIKDFEIQADEYEANKHFFLSHYFRDTYNQSLQNLPIVNSGINITRIEVWITNKQSNFENSRDIVAFHDIGENQHNIFANQIFSQTTGGDNPTNNRNNLYEWMTTTYQGVRDVSNIGNVLSPLTSQGFIGGRDYETLENARKLSQSEYTLNPQLGYISLNFSLNADEVLAVAYEYTMGGQIYQVGEFSTDGITAPDALIAKLIKGTNLSPQQPTWNQMMKNIYSIDAWQIDRKEFYLNILYQNDLTGTTVNYLPEGNIANEPLLSVLNLDNLNSNNDPGADGVFDFIEGITVRAATGRIIFPVVEPFGKDLARKIGDPDIAKKYVYQELYDSTLTRARQMAEKNKFQLAGTYKSSSGSEIALNAANIPRGSVVVTAGGAKLTEGLDYTVDYVMGSVKIINPALLESGTPIKISLENQALFDFQVKTLIGSHFDYKISDNFNIGATVLNLTERPFTHKVTFGNEAISNTIWGLNTSYRTESPFLTKLVDLLPFIETKEKSTINIDAEFAQFLPGHSRAIGKAGTVYIDDFEGAKISIDMRQWSSWNLSGAPEHQPDLFPEAELLNDLRYGYNRAKLAWYSIDPLFLRGTSLTPGHIRNNPDTRSSHFVREIFEREIFPNRNTPQGLPTNIPVLNIAFYPSEKGPYNFNTDGIDEDGKLTNPSNSWGGITREVPSAISDFEMANIEYIEFWLMDPFVEDSLHTGGDLYFNLGEISEDVLKDGKKSFENGLPKTSEVTNVDTTAWGRVPTVQSLVNAFDNNPETRMYQDVGLDGLNSEDERSFFSDYLNAIRSRFGEGSQAYQDAWRDPSNDNYRYFRSSIYDAQETGILDRYKKFNNPEGNSPATNQPNPDGIVEPYPTSASILPNSEDIDRDNNLNKNESYYQYRISLRPQDMEVGYNYITDKVSYNAKFDNGERSTVNWYQFKIPVEEFEKSVNGMQDFKSIRFIRLFMRGFEKEVILRFATLELVRGEWRKYNRALIEGQENVPINDLPRGTLDISTVNIEENNTRTPVNYVLPPGVTRVQDVAQPQIRELNEQAMELKVLDLGDGDARATYRNLRLDIRQYKKLMLDVHAEEIPGMSLADNDLNLFVRLGTDYSNNYYEYELPLVLTPPGRYNNNSDRDRERVWPRENLVDIVLERLTDVKMQRNEQMQAPGSLINYTTIYTVTEGDSKIKVVGNPSLSNVRVLMVGIRNPSRSDNPDDDGMPKSGIVWINELRLTQFNDKGGWAANTRLSAKLADLAQVNVSGSTIKPGFGSIEKKVNERSLDDFYQYDLNSTVQLGRFFPKESGVSIPLYVGFTESFANPEFNPIDQDVPLKKALNNAANRAERDSIKKISQDYNRRKSITLTNVRINKTGKNPRIYDIANFAVSYSFSEQLSRNINTEERLQQNTRGGLTYSYNTKAKSVTPFKNAKWLSHPYLRIIKDFNFTYIPSQLSFRTELNRTYFEQQLRNINNPNIRLMPTYSKDFTWNRLYTLNWDITQALRFDFNDTNQARIDEPMGMVNRLKDPDGYEQWKDSVWTNLKNFGRNTNYNHQFNLTYNVPINKIPLFNWVTASARYTGNYSWTAGPILPDTSRFDPGNTIQNSNTVQLTGQLNFTSLYGKVKYLKDINQKFDQLARGGTQQKKQNMKTVTETQENIRFRKDRFRTIDHRLKTESIMAKVFDEEGNEVTAEVDVRSESRIRIKVDKDISKGKVTLEGKVPERENIALLLFQGSIRVLMGVKNLAITYSQTNGTLLPGYKPNTLYMGMEKYNDVYAPGMPFVAGWQDPDFAWNAVRNQWLSTDSTLNAPFVLTNNENLNIRSSVEPIPGMRIEVSGIRSMSKNRNEYYIPDEFGRFNAYNPMTTGNFSISLITLGSAFEQSNSKNNYMSKSFTLFSEYRKRLAERLADVRAESGNYIPHPGTPGEQDNDFPSGYGKLNQEVLIYSFLAAYTGTSPDVIGLTTFPLIPMPNWQFTYDGLAKLKPFQKYLRTFTLRHGYRSTYTIGSYATNLNYQLEDDGFSYVRDQQGNFIPEYDITNVAISEQFNPLIGLDATWNNSLTNRVEVKNTRSLAMSFSNNQLSEVTAWEYIVGLGYRFENLPLKFRSAGGDQKTLKSDLRVNLDVSLRNNLTILRRLVEETNEASVGQRALTIKTAGEYVVSEQVTIRVFFDRVVNTPLVGTFATANTSFGFSVRFTLAQ